MDDRMITCPECAGQGEVNVTVYLLSLRERCSLCMGSGTIPDRRLVPTANDRAVERIGHFARETVRLNGGMPEFSYHNGLLQVAEHIVDIINEEAERG